MKGKTGLELIALAGMVLFVLFMTTQVTFASDPGGNDPYPPPVETSVPYPPPDTSQPLPYPPPDTSQPLPYPPPDTGGPLPYPPPVMPSPESSLPPIKTTPIPRLEPAPTEASLPPDFMRIVLGVENIASVSEADTSNMDVESDESTGAGSDWKQVKLLSLQEQQHRTAIVKSAKQLNFWVNNRVYVGWHWWIYYGLDWEQARVLPPEDQRMLKALALHARQPGARQCPGVICIPLKR